MKTHLAQNQFITHSAPARTSPGAGDAAASRVNPRTAFRDQRKTAPRRGIGWELSFEEWWLIWQRSGHWPKRGNGAGYVMCRKGDVGPYSVDNVFIATSRENSSNQPQKTSGLPMGVKRERQMTSDRFSAYRRVRGKKVYLGIYSTPEQAHAAYLRAWGEA